MVGKTFVHKMLKRVRLGVQRSSSSLPSLYLITCFYSTPCLTSRDRRARLWVRPIRRGMSMTGIQFLTDEKGRKVAVQIDLRKHGAIWEDFYDGLIAEQRRKEKGVPLATVKADLIKRGRLRG